MSKRLFVAVKIEPQPALLSFIRKMQNRLSRETIKWVEDYNLHLTLKFIGEVDDSEASVIKEKLSPACRKFAPFQFQLKGIGHFGQRVLFIHSEGAEKLEELAQEVRSSLDGYASGADNQPFKAHLTIGRIKFLKSGTEFLSLMKSAPDILFQEVEVAEVVLFESILKPQGPVYHELAKFPLRATGV